MMLALYLHHMPHPLPPTSSPPRALNWQVEVLSDLASPFPVRVLFLLVGFLIRSLSFVS